MVGVIDSGGAVDDLAGGRLFLPDGTWVAARPDLLGHGTAVAGVIRRGVPGVQIVHAQVFQDRPVTTAIQVAGALDWLAGRKADVICLSLGLAADRAPLRRAALAAVAAGRIVVAAAPARGGPCYPAAYPGVIAATGDARCGWDGLSVLAGGVIGAWCGSPEQGGAGQGGASLAAARVAGHLAARIASGAGFADGAAARDALAGAARFHGPECRGCA
ncbi:subtilisin [Rhodovulum strictum]|uniref:Subtilisin n=1 Tax=Rhodovulum strictum TaxID=58314 RepID=A0A844BMP5_9RHOB|nr:subtilisin [Rhodovulum strictum]